MDVSFSPQEEAFRQEVRTSSPVPIPPEMRAAMGDEVRSKEDYLAWHKAPLQAGLGRAATGPSEYGGTGWNVTQRYIFNEEIARGRDAARLLPFGLSMVRPGHLHLRQ